MVRDRAHVEPTIFDHALAEDALAEFARVGVNDATLAARLQQEGAESFDDSARVPRDNTHNPDAT